MIQEFESLQYFMVAIFTGAVAVTDIIPDIFSTGIRLSFDGLKLKRRRNCSKKNYFRFEIPRTEFQQRNLRRIIKYTHLHSTISHFASATEIPTATVSRWKRKKHLRTAQSLGRVPKVPKPRSPLDIVGPTTFKVMQRSAALLIANDVQNWTARLSSTVLLTAVPKQKVCKKQKCTQCV